MKEITLLAPTSGEVVALAKTDDRVFASGAMGEGFGLVPSESRVLAPVTGKVTLVAETKHAIGITTKTGLEVLVHMGIDTVDLAGRPFNVNVKVGHEVTAGTKVAQMDLAAIEKAGRQTTLLVLVTNAAAKLAGIDVQQGTIKAGEKVATGFLKDSQAAATGAKLSDSDLAKLIIEQVGGPDNIKKLIWLRKHEQLISAGHIAMLWPDDPQVFAYNRSLPEQSQQLLVINNFSNHSKQLPLGPVWENRSAKVLISNYGVSLKQLPQVLSLRPYESIAVKC